MITDQKWTTSSFWYFLLLCYQTSYQRLQNLDKQNWHSKSWLKMYKPWLIMARVNVNLEIRKMLESIFFSGQSCNLVGMPNLKLKSRMDFNPLYAISARKMKYEWLVFLLLLYSERVSSTWHLSEPCPLSSTEVLVVT